MSSCYYVQLKFECKDEAGLIQALGSYIKVNQGKGIDFHLKEHIKNGIMLDNVDDLMYLFGLDEKQKSGHYEMEKNLCYGWESVLLAMFNVMAPYLSDGSEIYIDVDDGYDKVIVKDGVAIQLH